MEAFVAGISVWKSWKNWNVSFGFCSRIKLLCV